MKTNGMFLQLSLALSLTSPLAARDGAKGQPLPASSKRQLVYLHGRIVQTQQTRRPKSPDFGYYELDRILDVFKSKGYAVMSEVRPANATVEDSARRVVTYVRGLLDSGIEPKRITVVGASMGGGIALLASAQLKMPDVRFAVMGVCLSQNDRAFMKDGLSGVSGRILAIREDGDEFTAGCEPWTAARDAKGRVNAREIVLHTGLRHGFLYRPMPEWTDPVLELIEEK